MRLSVLIPTLNEGDRIATAVEKAQRLGKHCDVVEVIVADGGSEDSTIDQAKQAGAEVIACPRGRGAQLRLASESAQGDVILMLHADCWLYPEAAQQMDRALGNQRVGAGAFKQQIEAHGLIYRALEQGNTFRAQLLRLPYGDQGIFVRRDVLSGIGGIPDQPLMEDVELMRRLYRRTQLAFLPGPIYVSARRWRRHGVVQQTLQNWSLLARYYAGVSAEQLVQGYRPECEADQQSLNP